MDFFAHQEQARKQTRRMLLLFALAVLGGVVIGALLTLAAMLPEE